MRVTKVQVFLEILSFHTCVLIYDGAEAQRRGNLACPAIESPGSACASTQSDKSISFQYEESSIERLSKTLIRLRGRAKLICRGSFSPSFVMPKDDPLDGFFYPTRFILAYLSLLTSSFRVYGDIPCWLL